MESLIQKENIHLTNILNPFDPRGSREFKEMPRGLSLKECIDLNRDPLTDCYSISAAINGELVPENADYSLIYPHGNVVICVTPQGGGKKNTLRLILQLAVVVIAAAATWYLGGAGGYLVGAGFALNTANAIAIGAGMAVSVIGNTLISALIPYDMGDANDSEVSQTYSWDASNNSNREGVVWPVLYGTTRIKPPIIGKYIEIVNNKQYLNILYAIADHAIDSFNETSVLLNDNPVAKDSYDITWEYRTGSLDQTPISFFHDTRSTKAIGQKFVDGQYIIIDVDGTQVEAIGVAISCPMGIYIVNDDGNNEAHGIDIEIEYKEINDSTWVRAQRYTSSETTISTARWSAGFEIGGSWYEYEVGSTNSSDHIEGDSYNPTIWLYSTRQSRLINKWHWVSAGTKINIIGEITCNRYNITTCTNKAIRRVVYIDNLPPGQYQVRLRWYNGNFQASNARLMIDTYIDYIEAIIYDQFSFPGSSVFGLRALATDKFSGSIPSFSIIATRSTVPVWAGAAYENLPANNPAWASYDILHDSFYGGGVPYSRIIYEDFLAWANNNDLHYISDGVPSAVQFRCNIYLDSSSSLRKVLNTFGQLGRGNTIQMGSKFTCFVDKLETLPAQSFIFNMANIKAKSFNVEYMDIENRANAVNVTFWDKENKYKQRTIEIHASDFDSATQEIKKTQLSLKGCTSLAEAIAHGNFALNCNRLLIRTGNWEADIDAIGCMPWDVVEAQHDVTMWGEGGLIVSATFSQVTLDKEITLSPGVAYTIKFQSAADDIIKEYTLNNVDSEVTTSTVSITDIFDPLPVRHDKWIITSIGCATKYFRLLRTSRLSDLTRKLICLEYNASIYDDTKPVSEPATIPTITYEAHLRAQEVQLWNGSPDTVIHLSWTGFAMIWYVFYKSYDDDEYTYIGSTNNPFFKIEGLQPRNEAYTFCVSHTRHANDGISTTLVVAGIGIIAVPQVPLNFTATLIDRVIKLSWDAPTDITVTGYSIYLNDSLKATNISGTSYTYSEVLTVGTYNFTLAALTVGGESEQTEVAGITITVPSTPVPTATAVNEQCIVTWGDCKTSLPIAFYKVNTVNIGSALRYMERINWIGERTYTVVAVDIAGNESAEGSTSITTNAITTGTDITTTGLTYAIHLVLTYAEFTGFNYVEIWAAETNNRATAINVGTTKTAAWTHNGLDLVDKRYYWIRLCDIYGNTGNWYPSSATAGIEGNTSTSPDDYILILQGYENLNQIAGSNFLIEGIIDGHNVVGVTGDLIIDGSVIAEKLASGIIYSKQITLGVSDGNGDAYIAAGKTDFNNTQAGFILGIDDSDSNKAKLFIGNESNYLNWDGSALTIRGALNASDITSGTLNVDRISSGSISVPVTAFTSGSTKLSSGTITLQSAEITTIGSVVFIIFSCIGNSDGSIANPATHDIKIYRDSTLIKEYEDMAWIYSDHYHTHAFSFSDTPAAGTYIYYAKATYVSGSAGNFSNRSLFLLELRK